MENEDKLIAALNDQLGNENVHVCYSFTTFCTVLYFFIKIYRGGTMDPQGLIEQANIFRSAQIIIGWIKIQQEWIE